MYGLVFILKLLLSFAFNGLFLVNDIIYHLWHENGLKLKIWITFTKQIMFCYLIHFFFLLCCKLSKPPYKPFNTPILPHELLTNITTALQTVKSMLNKQISSPKICIFENLLLPLHCIWETTPLHCK